MRKHSILLCSSLLMLFSCAKCLASWDSVALKSCDFSEVGLSRASVEHTCRNIVETSYTGLDLQSLKKRYPDSKLDCYRLKQGTYFLVWALEFDDRGRDITVWAMVDDGKIAINKQAILGGTCQPYVDGDMLFRKKDTSFYRVFLRYHDALYSGSSGGRSYAWEVDMNNLKVMALCAVSWPEVSSRNWPEAPVLDKDTFHLTIKMPTRRFLYGIWGTDWVDINYVGAGVEAYRKSSIYVEMVIPPNLIMNQSIDQDSLIEKNYSQLVYNNPGFAEIGSEELSYLLENYSKRVKLVDTRLADEYEVSKIQDSVLYKDSEGQELISEGNKVLIFYSDIGYRSSVVVKHLLAHVREKKKGDDINVYNLRGGILAWINSGGSVVDSANEKTNKISVDADYRICLPEGYIFVPTK
ncbi:hypothetical protein STSP2_01412 [Anaerohalosphaera lusitana]|uniref:Rhodanese domain-containing protein n=1 Tax=Anaerohalosphaera lusitana TaxID=1936003 RepID=A0A1U9NL72_9BACT|nr:rhodanese-like domain-containing protein [Anaerohalosphaera lusitana]AQT68256.1 hypothetical protein STSP2_01412 [Anaerohalosphaera lusitana]